MLFHRAIHLLPQTDGIAKHMEAVLEDMDLRFGGIHPLDGKIDGLIAESLRQKEELHVEGKAIDGLAGENLPGGILAERLETALGIADLEHRERAEHEIEGLPHLAAQEGLALQDAALGVLAVTDQDIRLGVVAEVIVKKRDIVQRHAEIGI